jgi:hypothetical protein
MLGSKQEGPILAQRLGSAGHASVSKDDDQPLP